MLEHKIWPRIRFWTMIAFSLLSYYMIQLLQTMECFDSAETTGYVVIMIFTYADVFLKNRFDSYPNGYSRELCHNKVFLW